MLGIDVAGEIETVGDAVTDFEVGDEVFGEIGKGHQWKSKGSYAEYVAVSADRLMLKPDGVSHEQAAAVPTSGTIALENLRSAGGVQPGDRVVVNGAGGGVGTLVVQIATASGATVTAVDTAGKLNMLESIGADRVIDYANEDFTADGELYDVIVDIPGNRSFSDLQRIAAEGARYVLIGHDNFGVTGSRWVGSAIPRYLEFAIRAPFGRQRAGSDGPVEEDSPRKVLAELLATGQLTPVIDRTFHLSEVKEALNYLQERTTGGSVIITV